jgi:hypothetical protein
MQFRVEGFPLLTAISATLVGAGLDGWVGAGLGLFVGGVAGAIATSLIDR